MVAVVSSRHRIAKGAINTLYSLVVNSNDQSSQNHLSSICYVSCDIRTKWYGVEGSGSQGWLLRSIGREPQRGPGMWGSIGIRVPVVSTVSSIRSVQLRGER